MITPGNGLNRHKLVALRKSVENGKSHRGKVWVYILQQCLAFLQLRELGYRERSRMLEGSENEESARGYGFVGPRFIFSFDHKLVRKVHVSQKWFNIIKMVWTGKRIRQKKLAFKGRRTSCGVPFQVNMQLFVMHVSIILLNTSLGPWKRWDLKRDLFHGFKKNVSSCNSNERLVFLCLTQRVTFLLTFV